MLKRDRREVQLVKRTLQRHTLFYGLQSEWTIQKVSKTRVLLLACYKL